MSSRVQKYKQSRSKYVSLARKFSSIAKKIAKKHGLKIQVQYRAKTVESLGKKIQDSKFKKKRLNQIHDLAGVRCILYTEDELAIFSRALKNEIGFESIVMDKTEYSLEDYNALHTVFKVGNQKICGVSFQGLKGLNCEIQMTSSLFHPWNELSHEMLYKNSGIDTFTPTEFEKNKKDMIDVINKHLWEATHKLNSAYRVHLKLLEAQRHFKKPDFDQSAKTNRWNNALNHCFKTKEFLENYDIFQHNEFDYFDWSYKLREKWKKRDLRQGHYAYPHIHTTTQNIISMLRFYSEVETFYFLIEDCFSQNEKIQSEARTALKNWFSFESPMLNIDGAKYFHFPINEFQLWQKEERQAANPLIAEISKNLLVTNFHSTEMSKHDALSINHRRINPTKSIRELRTTVFSFLFEQLDIVKIFDEKKILIDTIFEGCSVYIPHKPPASLVSMVSSDANKAIRHFTQNLGALDNHILRLIETHLEMPKMKHFNVSRSKNAILKKMNSNIEYRYFRDMTYIPEDYRGLDYEERTTQAQISKAELALDIGISNWGEWQKRIEGTLSSLEKINDFRRLSSFGEFVDILCKFNPNFSGYLFAKSRTLREQFFYVFGINLSESLSVAEKRNKIIKGFSRNKTKGQALKASVTLDVLNQKVAVKYLEKGRTAGDFNFFLQEVGFARPETTLLKKLFISAIEKLNNHGSCEWTIWWKHRFQHILPRLSKTDKSKVILNLVYAKEDNYWSQEILIDVCGSDADLILSYFGYLIENKMDLKLPYEMNKLAGHIDKNGIDLVGEVVSKIDFADYRHSSYLTVLTLIEPSFSKRVEGHLRNLLAANLEKNIEAVLRIMRKYSGTPAVDSLVLDIVDLTNNSEEYNSELIVIVEFYRQVYTGQFGRVTVLQTTMERVKKWRENTKEVKAFKNRMIAFLEKRIADEMKMATADEKARILQFERNT